MSRLLAMGQRGNRELGKCVFKFASILNINQKCLLLTDLKDVSDQKNDTDEYGSAVEDRYGCDGQDG